MIDWYIIGAIWFLISIPMKKYEPKPVTSRVEYSTNKPSTKSSQSSKQIKRPKDTGSPEIDSFVKATFDLNDELVALKEKLDGVSNDLAKSNRVLDEINNHSNGALGWASSNLSKGISLSINQAKSGSIEDMRKMSPTKFLASEMNTLKSGIVEGGEKLKSIPNNLKSLEQQAKSLLGSAKDLPKAAKSLGFRNAPKALKAISTTTGVLNNITGEVAAINSKTKKVLDNIDQAMQSISKILGAA